MPRADVDQPLNRDTIAATDPSDRLTDVLALPEMLRDALWKTDSANLRESESPGGVVVAGMGHSGLSALLARAALGDHASRPILGARAYGLPPWTTPDTMVICASYSGDTEETLSAFEAAGLLGAPRVVVTSGGRLAELARRERVPVIPIAGGYTAQTAIGYFMVAILEVAAACGAGPRLTSEIDVAAEHLEELVTAWGPEAPEDSEAKSLARSLRGSIPVIAGAGLSTPAAARWKATLNTIARVPAFAAELPDLDHHELAGWSGVEHLSPPARFFAVFLDDADTHPRVQTRLTLTRTALQAAGVTTEVAESRGQTAVERVLSLVLLGDLVAHYLAALEGRDPAAAGPVEHLKDELGA